MSVVTDWLPPGKASQRFCLGFVLGLTVASLIAMSLILSGANNYRHTPATLSLSERDASRMVTQQDEDRQAKRWEETSLLDRQPSLKKDPVFDLDIDNHHLQHDDDTEAQRLAKEVRVLVWVMTSPATMHSRAKTVRDTWGKRANQILFFSSESDPDLPAIGLDVPEGRQHLAEKTNQAFRYIYENHMEDADWFMKADDDTYVIMENLRHFLSGENSSEPVYMGHHFHLPYGSWTRKRKYLHYHSGGAGYVISKEALRRFGERGRGRMLCKLVNGAEDIGFGQCMRSLGVRISNSTDSLGRSRFHCFPPQYFVGGRYPSWYHAYDANGAKKGVRSMSDYAITFHYITPSEMRTLHYLIYHLRPHGISPAPINLNRNTVHTDRHEK